MDMDFKLAQESGIHTPDAVGFMPFKEVDGKIQLDLNRAAQTLAQDAALSTAPNIGAPAALYTYIDPRIIPVLFGAMNASKFFVPNKLADWTMGPSRLKKSRVPSRLTLTSPTARRLM